MNKISTFIVGLLFFILQILDKIDLLEFLFCDLKDQDII